LRWIFMWKKLLIVVAVVGAAAFIVKRVKDANDERALWHEATTAPDLR
jgi:flagellar biogenesis protein FliO